MRRGFAGRRLGGRPVKTVLGRCGATGDVQWRSRGLAVVALVNILYKSRLAESSRPTAPDGHESISVEVDFSRFWPEVVGLLLPTGPNLFWCKSNLVDFARK